MNGGFAPPDLRMGERVRSVTSPPRFKVVMRSKILTMHEKTVKLPHESTTMKEPPRCPPLFLALKPANSKASPHS